MRSDAELWGTQVNAADGIPFQKLAPESSRGWVETGGAQGLREPGLKSSTGHNYNQERLCCLGSLAAIMKG